jgi:hypothetical protein
MASPPPIKTTVDDIDALVAYLRTQVGWVGTDTMRTAIPARHADNRKIEAMRYIGLLDRDGANVKLTEAGRNYASGDPAARVTILRDRLRAVTLYHSTLVWMHFNQKESLNKADIANYWHDQHEDQLAGATGAALTDAALFFMRIVGAAELGRFVAAGVGRETHLEVDRASLGEYVTREPALAHEEEEAEPEPPAPLPASPPGPPPLLTLGTGLQVNVEIHIAADAKPATIEEIFKNMRKYLLDQQELADGS